TGAWRLLEFRLEQPCTGKTLTRIGLEAEARDAGRRDRERRLRGGAWEEVSRHSGAPRSGEPGIHNHDLRWNRKSRGYGFRPSLRSAGMTAAPQAGRLPPPLLSRNAPPPYGR